MAEVRATDGKHRGELNLAAADPTMRTARGAPSPELAGFVSYYWLVGWDLRGRPPYDQHVLTEPRQHYVFELDRETGATSSRIAGLTRGRFTRRIDGARDILGVAFHPGGFYPWVGVPVSRLTDRLVPLTWGVDAVVMAPGDDVERVLRVEDALRARLPAPDPTSALARRIVDTIEAEPAITRVQELTDRFGLGSRALQRLFHTYVGAGPKWVIRRFRLIEGARAIESGEAPSLTELAFALGYFDQSHFIRDFKAIVGHPPSEHARTTGGLTKQRETRYGP